MIKYVSAFFLVILSLFSCTKTKTTGNIHIEMRKGWGNNNLFLRCSTSAVYPQGSHTIANSIQLSGRTIVVKLVDAEVSQTGNSAYKVPAMGDFDLGYVSGTYDLIVFNGEQKVTCRLTVDTVSYKVSEPAGTGVSFAYNELFRMPRRSIWGSVWYRDAANAAIAKEFIDSVIYYGARPFTGSSGYYTGIFPFYVDARRGVYDSVLINGDTEKRFIYNYEGEPNVLARLVKNYRNKYENKITPHIFSFNDENLGWE